MGLPLRRATQLSHEVNLQRTIDFHVLVLDAVANRHVDKAAAASDELIDFVDNMFDTLEREVAASGTWIAVLRAAVR